ncbi:MAG: sulfite exporter TauE/SafE family protein [Rhodospirillales bacterium]|nr:sulfite exporter TauE/SafE family protein [Rhodospirillales bacterium]MDP6645228.1 sulfite exporter TauE/SafE family protein [Rhodospirillales bacterium]MDP6840407.1 sulfite exporter TauE/SafE family protein [Rhodospirillales bacterium]
MSYFIVVVFLAVAIGAFVKGVTGVGLPIVSVPVMAVVLGVEHAVAVMIIPSFTANISMVWMLRREASANGELAAFILLGAGGTVLGAWILSTVDKEVMFLVMAIWVGTYLFIRTVRSETVISDPAGRKLAPVIGFVAGIFQSATGLSFPVFGPYLQARKFGRDRFAFNAAALLMVFAFVQFISFTGFDLLSPTRIAEGLLAVVPMAIALPLGIRAARHFNKQNFDRLIVGLLLITAIILLLRGVSAI